MTNLTFFHPVSNAKNEIRQQVAALRQEHDAVVQQRVNAMLATLSDEMLSFHITAEEWQRMIPVLAERLTDMFVANQQGFNP